MDVKTYNRDAWDHKAKDGDCKWSLPVSKDVIEAAKRGQFSIILTPVKPVPLDWFPESLDGCDLLCLASGGGQQAPVLAAAGAKVTSFDNSPGQLRLDMEVAEREGLEISLEQGDAADLSRFENESFDFVFHPCSNCFMPDLAPVWNECYRVLRKGGIMVAGFHNSLVFIFDREKDEEERVLEVRYSLPYSDLEQLPEDQLKKYQAMNEPMEYGHTLEQQIGGQIEAGFVIAGLYEDYWGGNQSQLDKHAPSFIATKAVKK